MLRENNNKMVQSLILWLNFWLFYLSNQTLKVEGNSIHVTESITSHIRIIIQFFNVVIVVNAWVVLDESE